MPQNSGWTEGTRSSLDGTDRKHQRTSEMTPATITEDYRAEQQKLHANDRYGVASIGYAPLVRSLLAIGRCHSLSDYGAGKLRLRSALGASADGVDYFPYDPAFPEYGPPRPADLIACIDVLEHIEPHLLDACLDELASIARHLVVLSVHTGPAKKSLSDGRNAHLIQKPPSWWLPHLMSRFDIMHVQHVAKGFFVVACRKNSYRTVEQQIGLSAISRAAARCEPRRTNIFGRARRKVENAIAAAKRDVGALWFAARDPRTPWLAKLVAGAASFSALSPIDLTPDFIPVVGYLDDLILLVLGTFLAVRLIPRQSMAEYRVRAASLHSATAAYGALAIGVVWMVAAVAAFLHATQPIVI